MDIKASGKSNGKPADISVKGDVDGEPQTIGGTMDGGKMEGVLVGGKTYIKADEAYWKSLDSSGSSASMAAKAADKWLEIPQSSSTKSSDTLKDLVDEIKDDSADSNKKLLSDKATVTSDSVDGKDAWKIESEDKKARAWVSQEDSGDLLKLEGWQGKSSSGSEALSTINFLSHDQNYGIKAPSGAKGMTDILKG